MSDITVQRADDTHVRDMARLLNFLGDVMERKTDVSTRDLERNLEILLSDPRACILVALSDTGMVGVVNFSIRRTAMHRAASALIDELVISPDMRGKGIGFILINAAVGEARNMGCCEIEASTEMSNLSARRFYKKCGFDTESLLLECEL